MVYLDNSATTLVSPAAVNKMKIACDEIWGNPSSNHEMGLAAEKLTEEARNNIILSLGISKKNSGRLIFCGSGTEANNLAIFGTVYAKAKQKRKRIITDDSQHPSVMAPLSRLEQNNFEVIRIPTVGGAIDKDMLIRAINSDTVLVTVMLVNNETGARYEVEEIFKKVKTIDPEIICHTDAVQAFKKIKFSPDSLHADLISISGHKYHAPKGVGALYITENILRSKKIMPVILGGGQEEGIRSGTLNVPAIAAFGESVIMPYPYENVKKIREYLLVNLSAEVKVNIPALYVPNIISLTLPSIKSETMMRFLSQKGIYVSNGSACSSRKGNVSPILTAFGLTKAQADSTIRVSLCGTESLTDIETFISILDSGLKSLVRM